MILHNRILWIGLASAIVFAGAGILKHSNKSEGLPAGRVAEADGQRELQRLKQLEAELASLKALSASGADIDRTQMAAKLDALKREIGATLAAGGNAREPATADVSSGEPPNIVAEMAAEEEQIRQMAQLLDGALASEVADPSWSVGAAQEISRGLSDAALEHTRLDEVRCQSTLCRIEASHDSLEAEQGFILQLGQLESFRRSEGFGQRVERADGSVATTMFVSRSGHRLPDPSRGTDSRS
jgi:hypothetical protein